MCAGQKYFSEMSWSYNKAQAFLSLKNCLIGSSDICNACYKTRMIIDSIGSDSGKNSMTA